MINSLSAVSNFFHPILRDEYQAPWAHKLINLAERFFDLKMDSHDLRQVVIDKNSSGEPIKFTITALDPESQSLLAVVGKVVLMATLIIPAIALVIKGLHRGYLYSQNAQYEINKNVEECEVVETDYENPEEEEEFHEFFRFNGISPLGDPINFSSTFIKALEEERKKTKSLDDYTASLEIELSYYNEKFKTDCKVINVITCLYTMINDLLRNKESLKASSQVQGQIDICEYSFDRGLYFEHIEKIEETKQQLVKIFGVALKILKEMQLIRLSCSQEEEPLAIKKHSFYMVFKPFYINEITARACSKSIRIK